MRGTPRLAWVLVVVLAAGAALMGQAVVPIGKIPAAGGGGTIDGSGTSGGVAKWTDSDTLGVDTASTSSVGLPILVHRAANVDVVNTTNETTLITYTVPAGLLSGTDRTLRLELHGDQLNNSGSSDTWTLRIKYGATTMYADSTTWATNAVRMNWHCHAVVGNVSGASDQYVNAFFATSTRGGATTGNGELDGSGLSYQVLSGTAAENSATALALAVTLQHSVANASTSFRMKVGRIYLE